MLYRLGLQGTDFQPEPPVRRCISIAYVVVNVTETLQDKSVDDNGPARLAADAARRSEFAVIIR